MKVNSIPPELLPTESYLREEDIKNNYQKYNQLIGNMRRSYYRLQQNEQNKHAQQKVFTQEILAMVQNEKETSHHEMTHRHRVMHNQKVHQLQQVKIKHKEKKKRQAPKENTKNDLKLCLTSMSTSSPTPPSVESPPSTKHKIVVDGMNLCMSFGLGVFKSYALQLVLSYFQPRGYSIVIILPQHCFSEQKQPKTNKTPDDQAYLLKLQKSSLAFAVPSCAYDDSYIIQYAIKQEAFILSNDRYNDYIASRGKEDKAVRKKLQGWFKRHVIPYAFIQNDFVPDPDFLFYNGL